MYNLFRDKKFRNGNESFIIYVRVPIERWKNCKRITRKFWSKMLKWGSFFDSLLCKGRGTWRSRRVDHSVKNINEWCSKEIGNFWCGCSAFTRKRSRTLRKKKLGKTFTSKFARTCEFFLIIQNLLISSYLYRQTTSC